jgi:hypothetical protein
MLALRSKFDGKQIITPQELNGHRPCDVIIVAMDAETQHDRAAWQAMHDASLGDAWSNEEDAVYDDL